MDFKPMADHGFQFLNTTDLSREEVIYLNSILKTSLPIPGPQEEGRNESAPDNVSAKDSQPQEGIPDENWHQEYNGQLEEEQMEVPCTCGSPIQFGGATMDVPVCTPPMMLPQPGNPAFVMPVHNGPAYNGPAFQTVVPVTQTVFAYGNPGVIPHYAPPVSMVNVNASQSFPWNVNAPPFVGRESYSSHVSEAVMTTSEPSESEAAQNVPIGPETLPAEGGRDLVGQDNVARGAAKTGFSVPDQSAGPTHTPAKDSGLGDTVTPTPTQAADASDAPTQNAVAAETNSTPASSGPPRTNETAQRAKSPSSSAQPVTDPANRVSPTECNSGAVPAAAGLANGTSASYAGVTSPVPAENTAAPTAAVTPVPTTDKPPSSPATPPAAPPKMLWANLFKGPNAQSPPAVVTYLESGDKPAPSTPVVPATREKPVVSAKDDSMGSQLGGYLTKYKVNNTAVCLQPRGMINHSNNCYVNASIQALASVPQFYHLFNGMNNIVQGGTRLSSSTPMCDTLLKIFARFTRRERQGNIRRGKNADFAAGTPFEPDLMNDMVGMVLKGFKSGHQEDAHEFLSAALNCCHEEMWAVIKLAAGESGGQNGAVNGMLEIEGCSNEASDAENAPEDDTWQEVGRKQKKAHVQRPVSQRTPITGICGGMLSNNIQQTGGTMKQTVLENFFDIQLDIQDEHITSVNDALDFFTRKETIEGTKDPNTGVATEWMKRTLLEELPPVLILHLKTFLYEPNTGVSQKIIKNIKFDVDLNITRELLSENARNKIPQQHRHYKLCSVVFHHGKQLTGGHYTAVTFDLSINGWCVKDDSNVAPISEADFLNYADNNIRNKMPYILVYRQRATYSHNGADS